MLVSKRVVVGVLVMLVSVYPLSRLPLLTESQSRLCLLCLFVRVCSMQVLSPLLTFEPYNMGPETGLAMLEVG